MHPKNNSRFSPSDSPTARIFRPASGLSARPARRFRSRIASALLAFAIFLSSHGRATTAAYLVSSGSVTQTGQTYTSATTDTSAIGVNGTGKLTLNSCTITTSGATTSSDNSSFYGLNAGILVDTGGTLTMAGGTVTTSGDGANGVFAYSTGAATLSDITVNCTGRWAHAVMCSGGGTMTITNLIANTAGVSSGAIATDRGSGTITVTGGTIKTTGSSSPAIYSTGTVTVTNASLTATSAEAVVIEGLNNTTLNNCTAIGTSSTYGSVLVVQSTSGDAATGTATFTMNGGSLTSSSGPLFFVTNTDAVINLNGVTVSPANGTLIDAAATTRWGTTGSNGGAATFTASGQTLVGALTADSISSITASLKSSSTLTGALTKASLTIDSTSRWNVSAASTLPTLTNSGTIALTSTSATLTVTGTATLGGQLVIAPPTTAGTYTLITAGTISGTFSGYSFSTSLASGLSAALTYTSTAVKLTITGSATASGPTITAQPTSHTVATGHSASFAVVATASAGSLSYQWSKDGTALLGATSPQLLLTNVSSTTAGTYTVRVSDSAGSITSSAATLSVATTSDPGRLVNMSVLANSGTGSDVLIAGFVLGGDNTSGTRPVLVRAMGPTLSALSVSGYMTDPTLSLASLGASSALATNDNWGGSSELTTLAATIGAYAFIATSSADAAISTRLASGAYTAVCAGANSTTGTVLAEVYDADSLTYSATTPRLINVSARGALGSASLTAGFVINGSTAVTMLLRGLGPYLTTAGLTNVISNPALTLYRSVDGVSSVVATNDDWGSSATLLTTASLVGASTISSANEAVLLLTLDPGVYSFSVSDTSGSTAEALIEAYEVP